MPEINSIKEMAQAGQSVAGISRELAIDEKTVRKYLKQEDFSPRPPEEVVRPSKLDPHKGLIDTWLEEDQGRWHKQRHMSAPMIKCRNSPTRTCRFLSKNKGPRLW